MTPSIERRFTGGAWRTVEVDESSNGGSQPLHHTAFTLEAADILILNATPFEVIPAPGPNKYVVPTSPFARMNPGGTAYLNGSDVLLGVGPTANGWYDPWIRASDIRRTTSRGNLALVFDYTALSSVPNDEWEDLAWFIWASGAEFDTGDGTLDVSIYYLIHDLS